MYAAVHDMHLLTKHPILDWVKSYGDISAMIDIIKSVLGRVPRTYICLNDITVVEPSTRC